MFHLSLILILILKSFVNKGPEVYKKLTGTRASLGVYS